MFWFLPASLRLSEGHQAGLNGRAWADSHAFACKVTKKCLYFCSTGNVNLCFRVFSDNITCVFGHSRTTSQLRKTRNPFNPLFYKNTRVPNYQLSIVNYLIIVNCQLSIKKNPSNPLSFYNFLIQFFCNFEVEDRPCSFLGRLRLKIIGKFVSKIIKTLWLSCCSGFKSV